MATKRQIAIAEHFIKKETKRMMKEVNAYDRGSDQNLKKSLIDTVTFLNAWVREIDRKQLETSDFKIIINRINNLIEDLKIHSENWDN